MLKRNGVFAVAVIGFVALALWLWAFGGAAQLSAWAAQEQRGVQNALAGALRAVHRGEPLAWLTLMGLCFGYGFFHAAGPGHGKIVMGGYAMGETVPRARLIVLTLAGSLGQALTAILLVYGGIWIFDLGRKQMTGVADGPLAQFSALAIILVGLWLMWRGARRIWAARAHDLEHDHDHSCCGHAHGPTSEQVQAASTWRSGLAVVAAIAIRPCTGALFVLILTYGMGIAAAGIAGALVMGLGTALLTLAVALGLGEMRKSLSDRLNGPTGVKILASIEICAGLIVALLSATLLRGIL